MENSFLNRVNGSSKSHFALASLVNSSCVISNLALSKLIHVMPLFTAKESYLFVFDK